MEKQFEVLKIGVISLFLGECHPQKTIPTSGVLRPPSARRGLQVKSDRIMFIGKVFVEWSAFEWKGRFETGLLNSFHIKLRRCDSALIRSRCIQQTAMPTLLFSVTLMSRTISIEFFETSNPQAWILNPEH
jgi:hypothetical protein